MSKLYKYRIYSRGHRLVGTVWASSRWEAEADARQKLGVDGWAVRED